MIATKINESYWGHETASRQSMYPLALCLLPFVNTEALATIAARDVRAVHFWKIPPRGMRMRMGRIQRWPMQKGRRIIQIWIVFPDIKPRISAPTLYPSTCIEKFWVDQSFEQRSRGLIELAIRETNQRVEVAKISLMRGEGRARAHASTRLLYKWIVSSKIGLTCVKSNSKTTDTRTQHLPAKDQAQACIA